MSANAQYDPQASYDLMYEDGKVGEVRQGRYFEKDWAVGQIDGAVFHYNGAPAGSVEGLTIKRFDQPAGPTHFQLVLQAAS